MKPLASCWRRFLTRVRPQRHGCALLLSCSVALALADPSRATDHASTYTKRAHDSSTVTVFVHGVLGDSSSTWTHPDTGVYWPDLVATDPDTNDTDVFVYSFASSALRPSLSIDEVAENLRLTLFAKKVLDYPRIAFVAHSMGGLVVRAFLLKNADLASNVRFLHLLSTPTTGASLARLGSAISDNPQFGQMLSMEPESFLANQQRAWLSSRSLVRIPTFCAYETQDTYGVRVVPMPSATSLCNRRIDPVPGDHFDIAKPADHDDTPHLAFRAAFLETTPRGTGASGRFMTRAYVRGVDGSVPTELSVTLVDDSNRLMETDYDPESGRLTMHRAPVSAHRAPSTVEVRIAAAGYFSRTFVARANSDADRIWLLRPKGAVRIERVLADFERFSRTASMEMVFYNENDSEELISDLWLLGAGTTNSICNVKPVRTIDYRVSMQYVDGTAGKERQVHDGVLTTQYCDGLMLLRIPTFIRLPPRVYVNHAFELAALRLRRTGFGLYLNDQDRTDLMQRLELLEREDQLEAYTKIQAIFHLFQYSGFSPWQDLSFVEPAKAAIMDVLDSYPISRDGQRLQELRRERSALVDQALTGESTLESRQQARMEIAGISAQIAREEDKLSPGRPFPVGALLVGGSSGAYDRDKELADPFPVWSDLVVVATTSRDTFAFDKLVANEFGTSEEFLTALQETARQAGLSPRLWDLLATPEEVENRRFAEADSGKAVEFLLRPRNPYLRSPD